VLPVVSLDPVSVVSVPVDVVSVPVDVPPVAHEVTAETRASRSSALTSSTLSAS